VGSFGVVPLAVHSIAYNVIPVVFMGAVGLATGLAVRIGTELSRNVHRAKLIAMWCMGFAIAVGAFISLGLYWLRIPIIRWFTNDEQVFKVSTTAASEFMEKRQYNLTNCVPLSLQGCLNIWGRVCIFVFILYIFSINRAIMRALGMQWCIAAVVVTCLWCGALPAIVYMAVFLRQELHVVWTILPVSYAIMQVLLIFSYARVDWTQISDSLRCEVASSLDENKDVEMESLNLTT